MEFKFRYSVSDLISSHLYTLPRMPVLKYGALALFAFFAVTSFDLEKGLLKSFFMALIPAVLCSMVGLSAAILTVLLNKEARSEREMIFSDEKIENICGNKASSIDWSAVKGINRKTSFIFMKMDNGCHIALPSHAFPDEKSKSEFIEYANDKIGMA